MYKRGDKFLVKKGTRIGGTYPGPVKFAKKDYWVTLTDYYPGWNRKPQVEWTGSGGYWYRVWIEEE